MSESLLHHSITPSPFAIPVPRRGQNLPDGATAGYEKTLQRRKLVGRQSSRGDRFRILEVLLRVSGWSRRGFEGMVVRPV